MLLYCSCCLQKSICCTLFYKGGDIKSTTKCGRTVLHVAAAAGYEACIALLLENGAGNLYL